jgi:glyoxylase-like metal-dependent hydrolase (beta-lactamase superfamily II)
VTILVVEIDDVVGVRANNPSPLSLSGTNSWIVGRNPAWLIDPGPLLSEHLSALAEQIEQRGGLGGVALTHDHHDHSEGVPELLRMFDDVPLAAARGAVDVTLKDGDRFGPLEAIATPGHAPDHLAFIHGPVLFSGDAVLGEGSVFIAPDPGALRGYLEALERLKARAPQLICPGHGPLVSDPIAKLDAYIEHRLERERKLVEALDGGERSVEGLLDAAWADVPTFLRPAAAITLAAHLDKLAEEGRLPERVERPAVPNWYA